MNLLKKLEELNLPLGKYVVVGGAALSLRGIRSSNDIDILVTKDVYSSLKLSGWKETYFPRSGNKILLAGPFDIGTSWQVGEYKPDPRKLIREADSINGYPVLRLEDLLAWKKACGRHKDREDIRLIESYLADN